MYEPNVCIKYQNNHFIRRGKGFSKGELEKAGLNFDSALWIGIPIDRRRKTLYEDNVNTILEILEKLDTLYEEMKQEQAEEARKEEKKTSAPPKKKKEDKPKKVKKKSSEIKEEEIIPLNKIPGVGPKTAERLQDAGFNSANDISKAAIEDLEAIKGISKKMAADLIEKAKEL